MLSQTERAAIAQLWVRKLNQDAHALPQHERHRNLEPDSAEFVCTLASGCKVKRLLEIGGSSGISTIALAAAARQTGGKLVSIEIEPIRQTEAKETIKTLGLIDQVDFQLADAATVLPQYGDLEFVLIDCEKDDYVRFYDLLRLTPGAIVVADNILSHRLTDYVAYVRSRAGVESITLPIGKGLEVTSITESDARRDGAEPDAAR